MATEAMKNKACECFMHGPSSGPAVAGVWRPRHRATEWAFCRPCADAMLVQVHGSSFEPFEPPPTEPKCPCTREQDCEACSTQPASPYVTLGSTIGRLVTEKQAAYGDSFGKAGAVMRILYPEGVPPEKLDDALTITRVLDKLFRVATDRDALGESPWRDVAGYALLAAQRTEQGEA